MSLRKALLFFLIFLSLAQASSASASLFETPKNSIKGKFAVYSFREGKHVNDSALYIVKGKSIKKVSTINSNPVWSPDGSRLLTRDPNQNKIYILKEDGSMVETVETKYWPGIYDWFPHNNNSFIYSGTEKLNEQDDETEHLYIYNLDSHTEKEILTFDKNQMVASLRVSPDGKKALFDVGRHWGRDAEAVLGIINLETNKVRKYAHNVRAMGWFPDGSHFVVWTNIKEDGSKFNEGFGVIGKINVETGAFEIIRNRTNFGLQTSLSKDGRYIYYIRQTDNGGKAVFVQPLNSHEEMQITTPVLIPVLQTYSQDSGVSWSQK